MSTPKLSPVKIRRALQSAAKCDATVISEDWLRAFWYEENWSDGVDMAKYDNGSGDYIFVFFTSDGKTVIKGFDHNSEVSPHACDEFGIWPGMYDGLPSDLEILIQDEAVEHENVTFCCWCLDGQTWETGNAVIPEGIDDGSSWLLSMIQMGAIEFIEWGKSYYEDSFERIGEEGVFETFKPV